MGYQLSGLTCPRCGVGLYVAPGVGGHFQCCGTCGGVLIDSRAEARIAERLQDGELHILSALMQIQGAATQAELRCPTCQAPMQRVLAHHVAIDRCDKHGVWYDKGELESVTQAVRAMKAYGQPRGGAPQPRAGMHPGAVGAAALGVGLAASHVQAGQNSDLEDRLGTAADVLETGLDVGLEVADGIELLDGGLLEAGAELGGGFLEGAGDLLGGGLELVGALFEGL
ncbi:MAG: Transcription factor zinc-finger [Pseudomonadota bacterium]